MKDFWVIVSSAGLSVICVFSIRQALATGEWHFKFGDVVYREENPNWFRATIVVASILAGGFACAAIYLASIDLFCNGYLKSCHG